MHKSKVSLIIFLLILSQATICDYLKLFNIKPNLILIALMIVSISFKLEWSLIFSLILGALTDLLGISKPGISVLFFPLLCFLIIKLSRKITLDNAYIFSAFTGILVVIYGLTTRFFLLSLGNSISIGIFLRVIFIESIYTALISLIIFKEIKIQ
jgi:rod shape-determining protein MreD